MDDEILFYFENDKRILEGFINKKYIFTNNTEIKHSGDLTIFYNLNDNNKILLLPHEIKKHVIGKNYEISKTKEICCIKQTKNENIQTVIDQYTQSNYIVILYSLFATETNKLKKINNSDYYIYLKDKQELAKHKRYNIYYIKELDNPIKINFVPESMMNQESVYERSGINILPSNYKINLFAVDTLSGKIGNDLYTINIRKINEIYIEGDKLYYDDKIIFIWYEQYEQFAQNKDSKFMFIHNEQITNPGLYEVQINSSFFLYHNTNINFISKKIKINNSFTISEYGTLVINKKTTKRVMFADNVNKKKIIIYI